MEHFRRILSLLVLAGVLPAAVWAASIGIVFDPIPEGVLQPPYVGTGTFSFATDPGTGTHPLTAFGAYGFSFTFGPATFSNSDLATPPGEILVVLAAVPWGRTIHFSNVNAWGSGPEVGSLDFVNGCCDVLSFEPPGYGGNLDLYYFELAGAPTYFGNYGAVPEPAAWTLALLGGAALLLGRRRARG